MSDSTRACAEKKRSGAAPSDGTPGSGDERGQRLLKFQKLNSSGYRAGSFSSVSSLADIRSDFKEGTPVRAAGRLMTIRQMGKSIFADLRDGTERLQIYVKRSDMPAPDFEAFKLLDSGDFIGVEGTLFTTRSGEETIRIEKWKFLAKALRPLPEKWHGLKDVELRFRRRYLDLIANAESRGVFEQRIRIIREIRQFLWERGFSEVETPMLQPRPGGAAAKPFRTMYESLSSNMFLRIAPELYLKKLLVGGFDRIFELNRNFRNEGISRVHNPEFTMLEVYQAYADVRVMRELAESLITTVAEKVFGTLQVGKGDSAIDLSLPWREISYRDLVMQRMGDDWFGLAPCAAAERASGMGLDIQSGWDHLTVTHEVYEKLLERRIQQPTFVTRLPRELVPLARVCENDPASADVFELIIGGKEIAPGYTELNDAIEQRKRLEQQTDKDAQSTDEDFLTALEYGMPPAGGMGIGIDRLVMILTGADAIRDVILFPQLKPK